MRRRSPRQSKPCASYNHDHLERYGHRKPICASDRTIHITLTLYRVETVAIDAGVREDPSDVFQPLSDALGAEGVALNYYERAPGESIGYCYHRHHEQEEIFYVVSGTVTFETEEGDVSVGPNELIRFAPGEWQQGTNRGDERCVVLALGAPREQGPTDLRRECPECGERTPATSEWTGNEAVFYCEVCGTETGRYA